MRQPRVLLVLTFGLAALLRIWLLGEKNLWLDEAASWAVASSSWRDLFANVVLDVHPPLYYVLLKGWMALAGDSEAALRGLSVAWGLIALVFAYRLAIRWLAAGPALVVLIGLAVSPNLIYFAQEARMYALATAAVLGALLAYRRWIESAFASRGALAGFVAASAIALYSHYFTVLALAICTLHLILFATLRPDTSTGRASKPVPWRRWIAAHGAVGVLYLPWIATAIAQMSKGQPWRTTVQPVALPFYMAGFARELFVGYDWYSPVITAMGIVIAAVVLAGVTFLVIHVARQRSEADACLLLVAVVPAVAGVLLLLVGGQMFLSRYLTYLLPLVLIAAARGWSLRLGDARRVSLLMGAVVLAFLPALGFYYSNHARDTDVRPVVAYLDTTVPHDSGGRTDRVLLLPGFMVIVFDYYSRNLGIRYERVEAGEDVWAAVSRSVASDATRPVWIIADYRWPDFNGLKADPRVQAVLLPRAQPNKMAVLRVRR